MFWLACQLVGVAIIVGLIWFSWNAAQQLPIPLYRRVFLAAVVVAGYAVAVAGAAIAFWLLFRRK
jgi:hypothetical protein